jgi:hypothetical protein
MTDEGIIRLLEQSSSETESEDIETGMEKIIFYEKYKNLLLLLLLFIVLNMNWIHFFNAFYFITITFL